MWMLDFHSHILPQIDDGSKSVEMSLNMLRESWQQGITGIVLTPHFYADRDTPEEFLKRRLASAGQLSVRLGELQHCPHMLLGAEVHYYRGMGHSASLRKLCIGKSNVVLVEMPFDRWSSYMLNDIADIPDRLGLGVMIAHIDRYLDTQPRDMLEALGELRNVYFQANADFFLQRGARRRAVKMLRRGEIQFLGSDCHNMTTRAPNLGAAVGYIQDKLGEQAFRQLEAQGSELFRAAAKR